MPKAVASFAGAILVLGCLCQPRAAEAQPFGYPPNPVAWIVAEGFFGFSGYPWAAPPAASPIRAPAYGCYFTVARIKNAWRRVEVCA
jgi:hypothetical protein